jgi:hypothetical protein
LACLLPTSPSHVAVRVASLTVDIELGVTRAAAEIPALSKATVCCRSCTAPSTTSKTHVTVLCQHGLDPLDDSPRDWKPKSPRSPNGSRPSTGYPRASRRRRRGPGPTTAAKEARTESSRIQPSTHRLHMYSASLVRALQVPQRAFAAGWWQHEPAA